MSLPPPGREGTRQRPVRSWVWSVREKSSAGAAPGQGQVALRVRSASRAGDFRTGHPRTASRYCPLLPAGPTRAQAPLFPGESPACGGREHGRPPGPAPEQRDHHPGAATNTPGPPPPETKCPRPALSASSLPPPLFPFPHLGFVTSLDPLPLALLGDCGCRPRVAMVMQGRAGTPEGAWSRGCGARARPGSSSASNKKPRASYRSAQLCSPRLPW